MTSANRQSMIGACCWSGVGTREYSFGAANLQHMLKSRISIVTEKNMFTSRRIFEDVFYFAVLRSVTLNQPVCGELDWARAFPLIGEVDLTDRGHSEERLFQLPLITCPIILIPS